MTTTLNAATPIKLEHITSVFSAFKIVENREYCSFNSVGHYDGGMSFLSVLGENANTQPKGRGATLVCSWEGLKSQPLPFDAFDCTQLNLLYDFNGSGKHFSNNDSRYFLPYGSKGLLVKEIRVADNALLLEGWCAIKKGPFHSGVFQTIFRSILLWRARTYLSHLNQVCAAGKVSVAIVRASTSR